MVSQLAQAKALHAAWKKGQLGGEIMPEDAKPPELGRTGEGILRYLTLPMALNYQRNSYKLWEAATKAWHDEKTNWVFDPLHVAARRFEELQSALVLHRVALQPNKHPQTWQKICLTLAKYSEGKIKNLLQAHNFDIQAIKQHVQIENKSGFPYLAGTKICNYWLYVLTQYTDYALTNRQAISIAPDTHVIQASCKLGFVTPEEALLPDIQQKLEQRWSRLLEDSGLDVIDLHTPLWLWSRAGFPSLNGV